MLEIVTVVGARPQFIKAAALSLHFKEFHRGVIQEKVVHTSQHYDENMSQVFFDELGIPEPVVTLPPKAGSHGVTTGHMLSNLDPIFEDLNPGAVLVYGDTNSTLAAALAASKRHIPIVHVEAGLRSFNMEMPEEVNRILTDRISSLNLAPSAVAMKNLKSDGLGSSSVQVGDIMFDAIREFLPFAKMPTWLEDMFDTGKPFALVTLHRQENTDVSLRLKSIMSSLQELSNEVSLLITVHPRLAKALQALNMLERAQSFAKLLRPLSFLESLSAQQHASVVITDSGGMQKESFYLGTPCITIRDETEWPETLALQSNRLCPPLSGNLAALYFEAIHATRLQGEPYGDSYAAAKITKAIASRIA